MTFYKKALGRTGFTLVELAIVITIIGLLIGGVLKGQELLENARSTATVAQVKSYQAAMVTFRDIYKAMPGDMVNASNIIEGCTTGCDNAAGSEAGNGFVGVSNWASTVDGPWTPQATTTNGPWNFLYPGFETLQFWTHLYFAKLINYSLDKSYVFQAYPDLMFGKTHPDAKIGGGFIVGQTSGARPPGNSSSSNNQGPTGLALILEKDPKLNVSSSLASSDYALTPKQAYMVDSKMDDGKGSNGSVQGFGMTATAVGGTGCMISGSSDYNGGNGAKACGLVISFNN